MPRKKSIPLFLFAVLISITVFQGPPAQAAEPYIGQIIMFGGNFTIRGYAQCNGQLLSIASNTALFSILGTTYGGDGRTTFGLPDLRGRCPIHYGSGLGLPSVSLGQKGGTATNTLTVNNLPPHSHDVTVKLKGSSLQGTEQGPGGHTLAYDRRETQYSGSAPDVEMNSASVEVTVSNTGAAQPVNNMPPFQAVNFQIALTGLYPPRN
jgi:microcystin-dependent protein